MRPIAWRAFCFAGHWDGYFWKNADKSWGRATKKRNLEFARAYSIELT